MIEEINKNDSNFSGMDSGLPFGEDFARVWDEWIAHRRENHWKIYKPIGLKRTLSGIIRDSGNSEAVACKMIIQSIEKGWKGIFKLVNDGNKTDLSANQKRGVSGRRIDALKKW